MDVVPVPAAGGYMGADAMAWTPTPQQQPVPTYDTLVNAWLQRLSHAELVELLVNYDVQLARRQASHRLAETRRMLTTAAAESAAARAAAAAANARAKARSRPADARPESKTAAAAPVSSGGKARAPAASGTPASAGSGNAQRRQGSKPGAEGSAGGTGAGRAAPPQTPMCMWEGCGATFASLPLLLNHMSEFHDRV